MSAVQPASSSPAAPRTMLKLSRYFSVASGSALLLMMLVLLFLYYRSEVLENTSMAGQRNETLARVFANAIWPEYGGRLLQSAGLDAAALRERPVTRQVHEQLRALSAGAPVVKIKIYDLNGIAVFSSVPGEIGEDKSANSGFTSAREGRVTTELVHRGKISATEGDIFDVDVVSSYIPIRLAPEAPVIAVFELYSDVTAGLQEIYRAAMRLLAMLGVTFALFYALLLLADRIMQGQYRAIRENERNISAKNRELEAANQRMRLAANVFERSIQGIVITDKDTRVLEVNRAYTEITGYTAEEAIGKTPHMLSSGWHDDAFYDAMWHEINTKGHWQGEMTNRRKGGEIYTEWLTIFSVYDERHEVIQYIGMFYDITERRQSEERITRLAYYDTLTGLANRRLFEDRVEHAVNSARRNDEAVAVMFIDLDRFKPVNDSLGHKAGDLLLKQVAARLSAVVRDCDTVARLGGDEFAVLLNGQLQDNAERAAAQVAQRILDALAKPFFVEGNEVTNSASVGISFYPADGATPDALIKHADVAMYQAKQEGRNRYRFFLPAMNAGALEKLRMAAGLHHALERGEFELHFQPQVSVRDGTLCGAEVLLRWRHPERGLVMPGEFIALAEETNLIVPIGRWVLEEACRKVHAWEPRLPANFRLAVNLSARQFQGEIDVAVAEVLAATGADPARIELEVTESMLMSDAERAIARMLRLTQLGVRLSLDDFGTGYSSLAYLRRFPLKKVKIDRSFVRDLPGDRGSIAVIEATIALAHSLGLKVIAEGVETTDQLEFLRKAGCGEFQGYLCSRPVPTDALERFFQERSVAS